MTIRNTELQAPAIRMTPLERQAGRLMRAPDHNDDDGAAERAAAAAVAKVAADKAAADKIAADKAAAEKLGNKDDAAALKAELARLRADAKKAKEDADAALARFNGIDPEEARKALEAAAAAAEKALIDKGEFERVRASIVEANDIKSAALQAEIDRLTGTVTSKDKQLDNLTVGQNFATSKFIAEKIVLTPTKTRALYGSHFELEDGVTVAYDKPAGEAGRTKYLDDRGLPMGFEAAIEKIINSDPEHEHMLKASILAGAGSKTEEQKIADKAPEKGVSKILAGLNAMTNK